MASLLAKLLAHGGEPKASEMKAYHKTDRVCLGVSNPVINDIVRDWQVGRSPEEWLSEASSLWDTGLFEARIAAAKLMTKSRITDDRGIWTEICSWIPEFDGWAISDHACKAGELRLLANPSRLDTVETWTGHRNHWSRRAALVMTLPWAKMADPTPAQREQRERILRWAARYTADPEWFIQKAVSWWLRTLSQHDPARVKAFMDTYGKRMKSFARKDAVRKI